VSRRTFLFLGASAAAGALLPAGEAWNFRLYSAADVAGVDAIFKEHYQPYIQSLLMHPNVLEKYRHLTESDPRYALAAEVAPNRAPTGGTWLDVRRSESADVSVPRGRGDRQFRITDPEFWR
jgi:hypothetical protein